MRRFLVKHPVVASDQVVRPLEDHLRSTRGWSGVDAVIDRNRRGAGLSHRLDHPAGEVIAVSADLAAPQRVAVDGDDRVTATGERGGHLDRLTAVCGSVGDPRWRRRSGRACVRASDGSRGRPGAPRDRGGGSAADSRYLRDRGTRRAGADGGGVPGVSSSRSSG